MDREYVTEGVIIAASYEVESLLPWWWYHYQRHCHYPVAFIDLGISFAARSFLQGKAHIIPFAQDPQIADPYSIEQKCAKQYGSDTECMRKYWFKKPSILAMSPFTKSVWLDLDCEVCGDISALFSFCDRSHGIALAIDLNASLKKILQWHEKKEGPLPITFSSGVVCYQKDSSIISAWIHECMHQSALHIGDQDALSACIAKKKKCITLLPEIMNWSYTQGDHNKARIIHWHSKQGKEHIAQETLLLQKMGWIEVL
jgi:hypothetical protein